MHPLYEEFKKYLDVEDKEKCIDFVLSKLDNKELDIITLYNDILTLSLNLTFCEDGEDFSCIWKEHVRTSIIRTIIECSYPYIIKERTVNSKKIRDEKVIIVCPLEEYHEIGARMVVDFFTLLGFDAIFIGANTPKIEIKAAIKSLKPKYIGISVTNYFNLVEAEKAIKLIKEETNFEGDIIVGGNAFLSNPEIYKKMGADMLIQTFDELQRLTEVP